MTRLEKSEIAIITVLATIVWFMTGDVANTKPLGTVLMWSAGLLLMQSLLRDLWLLGSSKKPQQEARQVSCICFESAVGGVLVIAGALILLSGFGGSVLIQPIMWPAATFIVLVFGYLCKDLVIGWRPWRIERDLNHINAIFKW